jgi:integrase
VVKPCNLAAALAKSHQDTQQALTLQELVDAYFARNPKADGQYRVRKWLEAFGSRDAWTLPSEELERAAEHLLAAGYQPGSVNRDIGILGSAYRWAKRQRICPRGFTSPTLSIRRYPEAVRRVEIDNDTLERLRAGAIVSKSKGFGAFVSALIDSGARKSEILERQWRDLDPEEGTLFARKTKTDTPRMLFLRPHTVRLVERLRKPKTETTDLIFPGRDDPSRPQSFRRAWQNLTKDIGRPDLHLHDLRHARAAALLRAGISSAVAAQALGHSPEVLHRRYGHLESGHLRKAVQQSWKVT